MTDQPDFWRGRKVLVTGHTGFMGSWLCTWLKLLEADLCGFALAPPTDPSLFESIGVADGMTSVIGDVRDLERLSGTLAEHGSEMVIHMAAQSLVRDSYDDPVETYTTNVLGTVNALEAARRCDRVKLVLVITSDKCYENREVKRGYLETDRLGGKDPYSSSKACAELVTAAYRSSFRDCPKVASLRAGNIIGGGDWSKDRLVPDTMRAFEASRPVLIRSPDAVRAWHHVLDALSGYLRLAQELWSGDPKHAGAWNFGPDQRGIRTVGEVVESLAGFWGPGASWERDHAEHPAEAMLLGLDSRKARERLGYRPRLGFLEALEWTVRWYKSFSAGEEMRRVTEAQIHRYAKLEPLS